MSQADATVVQLPEDERPTKWYNILGDLPEPLPPPKDPETGPSRLKALPELLLAECLRQENSTQRWIDIPAEIQDLYVQAGRPRPLIRAARLEKRLGTPAHLYYKTEFYSPTGSHKVNTALAQAWYAKREGYERVTTETGAGQWGTALAYAASLVDLKTTIYWVRAVHDWKTQRRHFMKLYGATVHASTSSGTNVGGFPLPFVADAFRGKEIRFIAAPSAAAPNLQGQYRYDFADHAELTPMLKMYTLGHKTDMRPVRGDGLRYHGCSPILSLLRHLGYIDTIAYPEDERHVFERGRQFVQTEGFLPAPESA